MSDFIMPSLGSDMEVGTLVEWQIKPGDQVERGQIVAVVETQKGAIEIEIFETGIVQEILVKEGQEVPIGTVLARIQSADTQAEPQIQTAPEPTSQITTLPEPTPPRSASEAEQSQATPATLATQITQLAEGFAHQLLALLPQGAPLVSSPPLVSPPQTIFHPPSSHGSMPIAPPPRTRVSPAARQRARELGVSLEGLTTGSGPRGAIALRDIEALAAKQASAPQKQPEKTQKTPDNTGMREVIGAAMSRAKREIPHYYLGHSLDLTPALAFMRRLNQERPVAERLVYPVLLIKAVALALKKFPEFNGYYQDGGFIAAAEIHIGMAIALRNGGLVAPALHHADQKDLSQLMAEFLDLVNRARNNQLKASEMRDATITITNLGDQGVESVYPIINPPQVAMVGFGKLMTKPWVVAGELAIREIITVSLSADHRVSDGRRGALFLNRIEQNLIKLESL